MGRPKALLAVSAEPGSPTFVSALVTAFAAAGCAPIVVVQGAYVFEPPSGALRVVAADWALGMRVMVG